MDGEALGREHRNMESQSQQDTYMPYFPHFTNGKLRLREEKWLAQGHRQMVMVLSITLVSHPSPLRSPLRDNSWGGHNVALSLQGSEAFRAYGSSLPPPPGLQGIIERPRRWHENQSKHYRLLTWHYPFLPLPGSNTHLRLGGPGAHCCLEPSSLPNSEI